MIEAIRKQAPSNGHGESVQATAEAAEPAEAPPLRLLIADDDRRTRERLRELLAEEPDVEVVAECGRGADAVAAIRREAPDLVLLDTDLPGLDGFGLVAQLGGRPPVVLLAEVERHAARAFEAGALDYVVKPLRRQRLQAALLRARGDLERRRAQELCLRYRALLDRLPADRPARERLALRSQRRILLLDLDEVDWIDASGNYVRLHTPRCAHRLRTTMADLEARLDGRRFLRIHRSAIVNLDRVEELVQNSHGDYHVVLAGGTTLPLGRSYRGRLSAALAGPLWVADGGDGAAAGEPF
jgi:two-component system LytT family response regulator